MKIYRRRAVMRFWTTMVLAGALTAIASAHAVTYKGTVTAVEPNPYAASDGVLAKLEITVSNRRRTMTFDITRDTRLWRGETPVSFADAGIQAGEAVAVTYTDEEPENGAQHIRLSPRSCATLTKNSAELQ